MARCKDAHAGQIPHGANELIVLSEQTVARLNGTVLYANGDTAGDVVIEIYSYAGSVEETAKFVKDAMPVATCITSADGDFAFDLMPGRYLLRAGTVESAGIKELQAIFRVKGRGRGRRHKVEIRLQVGT